MKYIYCIFCKSTLIKNNKCKNCNAFIFKTKKINNNKDIISSDKYNIFFNLLKNNTKIDDNILILLIELNLIGKIMTAFIDFDKNDNPIFYIENKSSFHINYNYKESKEYVFVEYLIKNPEFKKSTIDKRIKFIKKDKDKDIVLIFNIYRDFDKSEISIYFDFNRDYVYPYDLNLLNSEEKKELNKNIENKLFINNQSCYIYENYGKIYSEEIIFNFNNINYHILSERINQYYEKINQVLTLIKEDNKKFFERSLLELELKNF